MPILSIRLFDCVLLTNRLRKKFLLFLTYLQVGYRKIKKKITSKHVQVYFLIRSTNCYRFALSVCLDVYFKCRTSTLIMFHYFLSGGCRTLNICVKRTCRAYNPAGNPCLLRSFTSRRFFILSFEDNYILSNISPNTSKKSAADGSKASVDIFFCSFTFTSQFSYLFITINVLSLAILVKRHIHSDLFHIILFYQFSGNYPQIKNGHKVELVNKLINY